MTCTFSPISRIDSSKDGINKTASGLLKIIYPHREATKVEIEQLLRFAVEGRKRVKTEIMKIDRTFDPVVFRYKDLVTGEEKAVSTAEEQRYPHFFRGLVRPAELSENEALATPAEGASKPTAPKPMPDKPQHFTVAENQTGISYQRLFADHLRGARKIEVIDPYIRKAFQIRNFVEFLQVILAVKEEGEDVEVHLVTDNGEISRLEVEQNLDQLQDSLLNVDINFSYEIASDRRLHARSITTDTGWKISLDRGLDIFQRFDGGLLSIQSVSQETRFCKGFEITYIKK